MDVTPKNVVVIMDTERFSKEDVVRDMQEEGYPYNFFFANFSEIKPTKYAIENADEVWTWGDCTDLHYYKYAREVGSDLWCMRK